MTMIDRFMENKDMASRGPTTVKSSGVFGVIPNDQIRLILSGNPFIADEDAEVEVQDPYESTVQDAIMECMWTHNHDLLIEANIDPSDFYSYLYSHPKEVLYDYLFWDKVKDAVAMSIEDVAKDTKEESEEYKKELEDSRISIEEAHLYGGPLRDEPNEDSTLPEGPIASNKKLLL